MTAYLAFLALAVGGPLVLVTTLAVLRGRLRSWPDFLGIGALMAIAFSYTFLWDGTLIRRGVWWYGDGVVWTRVWVIPVGELAFFLLQTALAGVWLYSLDPSPSPERPDAILPRALGLFVLAVVELAGLALVFTTSGYYLGYILVWAAPILGFLWFVGAPVIWRARRVVAVAIAVPTVYLWVVDRVAIGLGLWTISPTFSTGVAVFGLPIEEMTFFLLTNTLVVFGLVLYQWVVERAETRSVAESLLGLLPRGGVGDPSVSARKLIGFFR